MGLQLCIILIFNYLLTIEVHWPKGQYILSLGRLNLSFLITHQFGGFQSSKKTIVVKLDDEADLLKEIFFGLWSSLSTYLKAKILIQNKALCSLWRTPISVLDKC